jgi:5-methylcytosine-specific restriction enzyme A
MSVMRACVRCGIPSKGSYCPEHKPQPWENSRRRQRVTVSGWEEQRRAKRVLARFLFACHWCGRSNPQADQVDHVVPLAEGGADDESNLAPIHDHCHVEKTQAEAKRARP